LPRRVEEGIIKMQFNGFYQLTCVKSKGLTPDRIRWKNSKFLAGGVRL